jgi:distribution and morphology protein 10
MRLNIVVSLGAKYVSEAACTTLTMNPLLGHLSSSFTSNITSALSMGTRYDFNVYSYDSDLSFGFVYTPQLKTHDHAIGADADTDQEKPIMDTKFYQGTLLRFFVKHSKGIALIYQQQYEAYRMSLGVEVSPRKSSLGIDIEYTV